MSGEIILALDKAQYGPHDTIVVSIFNSGPIAILVADHQTNCSLICLQRLSNGAWQQVQLCRMKTPTRLIEVPAASTMVQRLVPGSDQATTAAWLLGIYRAALQYGTRVEGTFVEAPPLHSAEFAVA
ncbi:MAG TPA: hypothetical protein VKQ30_11060 [Ktedonobacterales bacterium]|nr:hypothetical protein [Ktedonobacterales bacterium]